MTEEKLLHSRVSKLFIDRDRVSDKEALQRRQNHMVTLVCGGDVGSSYTLQLAVVSAANIASRCFPGAVTVVIDPGVSEQPFKVWPGLGETLGQAISKFALVLSPRNSPPALGQCVLFGNAPEIKGALRATFDGWIAKVGPAEDVSRLQEREYCPLIGVLMAALAISESFLAFAEVAVEAGYRTIGRSLWRPELSVTDPAALGMPIEFLPKELWVLGLGHLGNAYLWSLAALPYIDAGEIGFVLGDFDKAEAANFETGLLFNQAADGRLKTRICAAWLEERGFTTRLVERYFDADFRCRNVEPREPALALCGFDSNEARRALASANFARLIDAGLGDTADNFDTIGFHTLPNPRNPDDIWPVRSEAEKETRRVEQERYVREHPVYAGLAYDECGKVDLAGKSVAVPFVGAAAATLAIAESLRLLHGGPAYTDIKWRLSSPRAVSAKFTGQYSPSDAAALRYVRAARW